MPCTARFVPVWHPRAGRFELPATRWIPGPGGDWEKPLPTRDPACLGIKGGESLAGNPEIMQERFLVVVVHFMGG